MAGPVLAALGLGLAAGGLLVHCYHRGRERFTDLDRAAAAAVEAGRLNATSQAGFQEGFEEGRFQGWHEAHSCDQGCFDRILGPVAKTTSTTPEWN